jgi:peptidoglycan DL-endopeptidase CwlO
MGPRKAHIHKAHRAARHRRHVRAAHARAEARREFGNRVVAYARHFLGIRYSWGGTSPRTGFDCSGLVRFVYGHFGISLPHSSFADLWRGRHIARRSLGPGDLVFFADASHVGIYVGGGRFIDAPHTGTVVRISSMHHGWYESSYSGARRLYRG